MLATSEYRITPKNVIKVEWKSDITGGFCRITSIVPIDKMWGVKTDKIVTHRIFHIKDGEDPYERVKQEHIAAHNDLKEKLEFIFKANHDLLESNGTIRFNA